MRDFSDKESEDYDAQATLYRDLTTVLSIIAGFLSVALFTGNVDTNPSSPNFVLQQHYLLIYPVAIFSALVAFFCWKNGSLGSKAHQEQTAEEIARLGDRVKSDNEGCGLDPMWLWPLIGLKLKASRRA